MTRDEMRFYRRELINTLLHWGVKHINTIKWFVRDSEIDMYGSELKAYA
jgi:hypothetical protein